MIHLFRKLYNLKALMKSLFSGTFFLFGALSINAQNGKIDKRQVDFDADTIFIRANPDSPKAVTLLNFHYSSLPYDYVVECFEKLNIRFSNSDDFKELKNKVLLGNLTKTGTKLNSFSFKTDHDSISNLENTLKTHKLLLLDFWASWCAPCRSNVNNLKKVYSKYNSAGFAILSISIEDKIDEWKKAIDMENIEYFYHGLDDSKKSIQTQLGIFAIPTYILLDQEMKVVGKFNSRWKGQSDLEDFIKEYFKRH